MNHPKANGQDSRSPLESAGFMLYRDDEPGIYVRRHTEKDSIDWKAVSTELLTNVQKCMEAPASQGNEVPADVRR